MKSLTIELVKHLEPRKPTITQERKARIKALYTYLDGMVEDFGKEDVLHIVASYDKLEKRPLIIKEPYV